MINTAYPNIFELQRPTAVSSEAEFINQNNKSSQASFLGHSVFVQELYRQRVVEQFQKLNRTWKDETLFSSDVSEIFNNNAYRSIINLGPMVLPLIIDDLKENNSHWFYALEAITGENPISEDNRGKISLMKQDWLKWAESNLDDE